MILLECTGAHFMKKNFAILLSILLVSRFVYADTIVLKNGKTFEGTIVTEMKDMIIFKDVHGTMINVNRTDIDEIKKGTAAAAKVEDTHTAPPKVITKEYLDSIRNKYDLGEGSFGESEKVEISGTTEDFSIEENQDFKSAVLLANVPVLVDFYADWCGPCRQVAPRIEAVQKQYAGKMHVFRVNIDQDKDTAAFYSIEAIPTLIFFKDGEVQQRIVGAVSEQTISAVIKKLL